MDLYERLIRVIEAFMATFDGAMRIHGIQTLLLVQQASRFGSGINPSLVHRLTGAPLENIRRRFQHFVEQGLLESGPDPQDDRVTLFRMTELGLRTWPAEHVARRLLPLAPADHPHPGASHPLSPATYDALVAMLDAYADVLNPGIRIRGFKTALLIHRASLSGAGITASSLSRQTNAALETVRRHMAKHTELGDLRLVEDPADDRATRVFTADLARGSRTWEAVAERLDALDWRHFNIH